MAEVHTSLFKPQQEPKAIIEIVHGMSEHRKRYDDFAKFLSNHGYVVVTFDLPGHGEACAKEDLGYFGDKGGWDNLLHSVREVYEDIHKAYPDLPFFLFGHSMGSMLSRCYLQDHDEDLKGLILSGAPNYQPMAVLGLFLAKVLGATKGKKNHSLIMGMLVTGGFSKAIKDAKTPLDWLSRNEKNVETYLEDPYCGFPFTLQGYADELSGLIRLHDEKRYQVKNPSCPILFVAGAEDPCTGGEKGLEDSVGTLKKAGYVDITEVVFEKMRHEILNETEHEKVYQTILDWLEEHIQ